MKGRVSGKRGDSKREDICIDVCPQKLLLVGAVEVRLPTTDPSCLNLTGRACFERGRLNMDTSAVSLFQRMLLLPWQTLWAPSRAAWHGLLPVHGHGTNWHPSNSFHAPEDVDWCPTWGWFITFPPEWEIKKCTMNTFFIIWYIQDTAAGIQFLPRLIKAFCEITSRATQ